ncbi:MAG: hypothetical protein A2277_02705 [Desulfobacterales bacterium RIFOXYA12_FULL_46_15]|nr:MAG: hypothetical protein A2097_05615 [Desulfobacula sp. GWF2_41_7]OGR22318.1 MAG: hypothetical protein A2277_02705 [Desulfobacterales bacterium RIFOXYA12_FULL_46_15]
MLYKNLKASAKIIIKAKELGASMAGWALICDLKKAPSTNLAPKMPYRRDEFENASYRMDSSLKLKHGEVHWTKGAKSVLAIAVVHPKEKPEMDWWVGKTNPPGNKELINIINKLCKWIEEKYGYNCTHLPYQVGMGGLYLKDACVLAGIGCVGDNNMIITPEFGPRIRIRALAVDVEMPPTGPIDFYPCKNCDKPCRRACPQKAMDDIIYLPEDYDGLTKLPGRTGVYNIAKCDLQITEDVETAKEELLEGQDEPKKIIKYCRRCELACPIGAG